MEWVEEIRRIVNCCLFFDEGFYSNVVVFSEGERVYLVEVDFFEVNYEFGIILNEDFGLLVKWFCL